MLKDLQKVRTRRDSEGFTMLEVLLTLSLIASIFLIISRQQLLEVDLLGRSSRAISNLFLIKEELLKKSFEPTLAKPVITKLEELTITTKIDPIASKSSLKQFGDNVSILSSIGAWQEGGRQQELVLIQIITSSKEKQS